MLFSRIRELRREIDLRTRALGGDELAQECCTWWRRGAERGVEGLGGEGSGGEGGGGTGRGTFPGDFRLASGSAGRVCLRPTGWGKGPAVMVKIGLAGGAEESGVGGQAPRLGHKGAGLVTYQPHRRLPHSTSPHPNQPLRPIAPPKGKGGNGLCWISFMSAFNCPRKHCSPAGASPERAIRRERRVIIAHAC